MSILRMLQWLESTPFCTAIRESSDVYPLILTTHLVCLAVFGGMLLMSDMRLLGLALTNFPVSQIVGRFRIWKRVGLLSMIAMGLLLFSAKATEYYENPWFRAKVVLLALTGIHAMVFRGIVYSRTLEFDEMRELPRTAKIAGWLSLALWTSIVIAGRAIGYYEIPGSP